jgi:hypothetical protein
MLPSFGHYISRANHEDLNEERLDLRQESTDGGSK